MEATQQDKSNVTLEGLRIAMLGSKSDAGLVGPLEISVKESISFTSIGGNAVKRFKQRVRNRSMDILLLITGTHSGAVTNEVYKMAKEVDVLAIPVGKGRRVEVEETLKRYRSQIQELQREKARLRAKHDQRAPQPTLTQRPFEKLREQNAPSAQPPKTPTGAKPAATATEATVPNKNRIGGKSWTPLQIAFVTVCLAQKKSLADIVELLRDRFAVERTPDAISQMVGVYLRRADALSAQREAVLQQAKRTSTLRRAEALLVGLRAVEAIPVDDNDDDYEQPQGAATAAEKVIAKAEAAPKPAPAEPKAETSVRMLPRGDGRMLVEVTSGGNEMVIETTRTLQDLVAFLMGSER